MSITDSTQLRPRSGGSRSVDRALQIMVILSRADRPLRFADLQRRTSIAKGTLHGLLRSLEDARFVQCGAAGYTVGLAAFEVGTSAGVLHNARASASAALDSLLATTHETVHFGTLVDGDVLYLDRRDAAYDLRSASRIGGRKPAYGTALGKAMLALLDDAAVMALYPARLEHLTPNTLPTRSALVAQLHVIRDRRFATESEESTLGVQCIGVAIDGGSDLFGISLTVPVQRMRMSELERLKPSLVVTADELAATLRVSTSLGYTSGGY